MSPPCNGSALVRLFTSVFYLHLATSEMWCWPGGRGISIASVLCTTIMVHEGMSSSVGTIICSTGCFDLAWLSYLFFKHLYVFSLYGAIYTPCSKKTKPLDVWFVRKFSMYVSQRFPPNLQYVATLPCESRKSKYVTKFSCWTWQLICLTKI